MKWIKKNKWMLVAIVVFVLMVMVAYKALSVFFPSTDKPIAGDRFDSKVDVDKKLYDGIKTRMKDLEYVKEVSVRENGRTINIVVTVMDSTSMDAAKSLSGLILEGFTDSQIGYYDFQLYVNKEDKKENDFPILAYKQHNSTEFVWSKDRQKTVETPEEEGK